jgi:DnaJ-class molecular chaperone
MPEQPCPRCGGRGVVGRLVSLERRVCTANVRRRPSEPAFASPVIFSTSQGYALRVTGEVVDQTCPACRGGRVVRT